MSVSQPLRVGIAGAGWVTQYHLQSWTTLTDRASVVAIADPNVAAARARASTFAVPRVYDSVDAMLAAEKLDAIDVATPRETHVPIARMAARHGLAILCQKPLAPTLAEAEQLVAQLGGTRLMVHENWRFRPHYRKIAGWLHQQLIGEVRTVTMSLMTSGLVRDAEGRLPALVRQPMLASLERFLVMEVLIHLVDTLRFLLGPLTLLGARLGKSCDAVRGEDRATLLFSTASGAGVSLTGDFMARGYPPEQADVLEILGSDGAIVLNRERLRLAGAVEEDVALDLPGNYAASYTAAIAHFVERLADGRPFETGPDDNLETLRLIEAAYRMGGPCVHSAGTSPTC